MRNRGSKPSYTPIVVDAMLREVTYGCASWHIEIQKACWEINLLITHPFRQCFCCEHGNSIFELLL